MVMMNNNHKNSGCGYAEQMVSYLYGETGAAETRDFETHLGSCSICADELEAFSVVQFSINDWKLQEFADLKTPLIEIPYEKAGNEANQREVSGVTASWLSGLRNLFSLSPAWSLATASFAVLAVFGFFALIVLNPDKSNDVAGTNKNTKPVTVPTVEKTTVPETANTNQNRSPERDIKPLNEQKTPPPEIAVAPDTKNTRVIKTTNKNQRQTQRIESTNLPKNNNMVKRDNKNKTEIPPKMIEDDEEDDTLRLAELFEEIDTVE